MRQSVPIHSATSPSFNLPTAASRIPRRFSSRKDIRRNGSDVRGGRQGLASTTTTPRLSSGDVIYTHARITHILPCIYLPPNEHSDILHDKSYRLTILLRYSLATFLFRHRRAVSTEWTWRGHACTHMRLDIFSHHKQAAHNLTTVKTQR